MPNLVPIGGVYLLGQQQCSCALLSLQWQSMHLGNKFGRHNLAKQNGLNCCFLPKVAGLLKLFKQILIVGVGTGIIKYLWIAIPTTVVRMVISTYWAPSVLSFGSSAVERAVCALQSEINYYNHAHSSVQGLMPPGQHSR